MATLARRVVSRPDGDGSEVRVDYEGVAVPTRPRRDERARALTASQKIRRRHRAWMFLIDKGLMTYAEIAEDRGCPVQTIYYGVERARTRERLIKKAGMRHGL